MNWVNVLKQEVHICMLQLNMQLYRCERTCLKSFICLFLQHTTHTNGRQELSARSARTGVRSRSSEEPQQPHVGNYRLLKTIGKGNFAKVKLARHILTGREVSRARSRGLMDPDYACMSGQQSLIVKSVLMSVLLNVLLPFMYIVFNFTNFLNCRNISMIIKNFCSFH